MCIHCLYKIKTNQQARYPLNKIMPRFPTPCLDCGRLSKSGARCELCARGYRAEKDKKKENNSERQAKKKLLYNHSYRERAKLVKATATHCHICRQPFHQGDRIEADHLIPGSADSPLAAAHRLCNQRRGDKPL